MCCCSFMPIRAYPRIRISWYWKVCKSHMGSFDVDIEGRHPLLKVVACAMSVRSRLTGIATGDQAIFVRREAFPGFPRSR